MIPAFVTVAIVLVALGGLLAAADAALSVNSRADLLELASTARSGRALRAIAQDVSAHTNAINFSRVVAETTAAVLITLVFAARYGVDDWWLVLVLSAFIMTVVSFVLVGSSPRSVGREHSRAVLVFAAPIIRGLRLLLGPIASALVVIGNRVTPGRPKSITFSSEEQLLSMVDEATELEVLEEDDRELIHSIFEFSDTVVREVMIPRTDMVTIDGGESVGAAMSVFLDKGNSRMPVIGEDVDEVLGILYLRDATRLTYENPEAAGHTTVTAVMRPAVFVPESKKVDDMLRQMQLQSNHLAMVVDEYGGIAGLVTMEDLIEELVGDISDEYDREVPRFEELQGGRFRVSARLPVGELGELFDLDLDDDDVDSVGGLLTKALGRLPTVGARATVSGLILTADRTEGRRKQLTTVLVERSQELADAQAAFDPADSSKTDSAKTDSAKTDDPKTDSPETDSPEADGLRSERTRDESLTGARLTDHRSRSDHDE